MFRYTVELGIAGGSREEDIIESHAFGESAGNEAREMYRKLRERQKKGEVVRFIDRWALRDAKQISPLALMTLSHRNGGIK